MAKNKLFGNKPEPRCKTCSFGKLSAEEDAVMCKHAGVVSPDHSCRRFQYDPLKRVPRRSKPLDSFDEQAFTLDIEDEPATAVHEENVPSDAPVEAAVPPSSDSVLIPDDTDDIFGDLARLNIELITSSTPAAFRDFDPKAIDGHQYNVDENAAEAADSPDPSLVFLSADGEEDFDPLSPDDLIIMEDLEDEENKELLTMNPDGSFSSITLE